MNKNFREAVIVPTLAITLVMTALFAFLETVLRFFPVSDYTYPQSVNSNNPVARILPNREMIISTGWNFLNKNKVKVNNDGFINDYDYRADDTQPLVAIVGDSYIEAFIVPFEETLQGRVGHELHGKVRVYSFGFSGAPLSQYLIWAKYAREKYRNDFLVINIVGNDFDESLLKYKNLRGGTYYRADANGDLSLTRVDYDFSNYRFVFKSALMRYLLLNLQAAELTQRVRALFFESQEYVGNVGAAVTSEIISDSKQAIAAFFRDLPSHSGLPKDRVVLLIDAIRPSMYDDRELSKAEGSYYGEMRREFMTMAASNGHIVLDLQPTFIEHYKADAKRFEHPTDGHWNGLGHKLAAEAVMKSEPFKLFLRNISE